MKGTPQRTLSLRARLTLIILCPLMVIALAVGYWAYRDAQTRAAERFDLSLLSTVLAISRDTALSGGDALSPDERHPYMWAVKGHYYRVDLAFYNFPYAFGLLFGLGLYGIYEQTAAAERQACCLIDFRSPKKDEGKQDGGR